MLIYSVKTFSRYVCKATAVKSPTLSGLTDLEKDHSDTA